MREALILCPIHDNNDNPLHAERQAVVAKLLDTFGGVTEAPAHGHWKSPDTGRVYSEPFVGLTVACDVTEANDEKLLSIAQDLCKATRQEAIYVRLPSGDVEIVTEPTYLANLAVAN